MSNKNSTGDPVISLMQTFDDICNQASNSISISSNTGDFTPGSYTYYPYEPYPTRDWYDFTWWWSVPTITYKIETPSYPVSNYAIDKDGTSIIEIAISGFDKEEISIKKEDLKIIVEGKKSIRVGNIEEENKKYLYKHIATRDFILEYIGSTKWDYDKLEAKIKNGILEIRIPIKEECKPINKTYKILE